MHVAHLTVWLDSGELSLFQTDFSLGGNEDALDDSRDPAGALAAWSTHACGRWLNSPAAGSSRSRANN